MFPHDDFSQLSFSCGMQISMQRNFTLDHGAKGKRRNGSGFMYTSVLTRFTSLELIIKSPAVSLPPPPPPHQVHVGSPTIQPLSSSQVTCQRQAMAPAPGGNRSPCSLKSNAIGPHTERDGMREGAGSVAEVLPVGGGGAVLVLSELESMAARQQREIAQQRRLLEQREARLAVLRGAQEPAQQERLARLRHRLDQQQSKLNRLRLLRSQTDQSRANNATLTSDLDCIRALFNEKEKELSLAVAKVEELTRQLEELRGRHNGNATGSGGGGGGGGQVPSAASAELEKLRRELMYRNKMNEQQNQVVSQQRLVLAQRQAEMVSIDARIAQLQGRLQRKRALNQRLLSQQIANNRQTTATSTITTTTTATTTKMSTGVTESVNKQQEFTNPPKLRPAGNVAAIEPYSHIPNDNDFNLNKNDPKYQTLPYNTKFTVNLKPVEDDVNKNKIQHSQSASQIGQRSTLQQLGHQIVHSQSQSHIQGQSQLLGVNQQTSQQNQQPQLPQHNNSPQNYPPQSGNFLVHTTNNNNNNNSTNNNNNINNNNNQQISGNNVGTINSAQENQNHLPNTWLHSHQQQQSANMQQKSQLTATNLSTSSHVNQDTRQSITQAHNHRNLQTHQKPVSSVAPSFPVKSPIYQTSSTKIHPVMPQTLSLIGRGHAAAAPPQNYPERPTNVQNSQSPQQLAPTSMSETSGYPTRHNFQQGQYSQNYKNSSNNFPQASLSNLVNSNYPGYPSPSYNQPPIVNTVQENTNDKLKFDNKNQDKHDQQQQQMRYDSAALMKHDNQSAKLFDSNKHEQVTATQQRFEIPTKLEAAQQPHLTNKFEHSQLPSTHQYGKHEQHDTRTNTKYEHSSQYKHESHKYDSNNFQQFKQQQQQDIGKYDAPTKLDHVSQKYELNQPAKHDHGTKLEPPAKLPDKPYDYERTKTENDRKTAVNFVENKGIEDKMKPALPPKPIKPNPPPRLNSQDKLETPADPTIEGKPIITTRGEKEEDIPPIPTSELPESPNEAPTGNHQIIKARPLALKKNLLSEQPRLRYAKSNVHVSINRRIEMPPAFLFPETEIPADLMQTEQQQPQSQQPQQNITDVTDHSCVKQISLSITDELPCNDILEDSDIVEALNVINIEDKLKKDTDRKNELDPADIKSNEVIRRKKGNLKSTTGKANLSRRVSFDPLALLLDASLEGELELVKKTAKEVTNPSSANDEGITALHNAICAGHLDIVKFLVEFGCDVNAQDSDGWTPLHCAASCNNLAMVRFLVEHGACIFATTLSDHETAAEKCEEDEEGFDGCSEYLYSVQEKLGIMNNGQVFAVFEYDPQHNDELTLKNGDQLVILRKGDDNEREWWWSKLGHREGYVPRNLLGLYPRVPPSKID